MKKTGILLFSLLVWIGVSGQTTVNNDSAKLPMNQDSLISMINSGKISARDALLLQRLSPNQIMALEEQRLDNDRVNDMPFSKVQLFAIVMSPFVLVILIILLSGFYKNRESERKHELFMKALEAGQPIPESYFKAKEKRKVSSLQTGLIFTGIGIAFIISKIFMNVPFFFFVGLTLLFVGIALLIYHFITKPKNNLAATDEQ